MIYEQPMFLFDVTVVTMMLVFAYLSKRIGEAMHIRRYYKVFFGTSAAVVIAAGLDTIPQPLSFGSASIFTNAVRFAAAAAAFAVALRYWKWLFAEFSKK
jgi:hypothetical protein